MAEALYLKNDDHMRANDSLTINMSSTKTYICNASHLSFAISLFIKSARVKMQFGSNSSIPASNEKLHFGSILRAKVTKYENSLAQVHKVMSWL